MVIFLLLKQAYSQKVDEYIALGITGLNREWFLRIIGEIRLEIYTANHINSAFKAAGLYPYNPERALSRCRKSDPVRALIPTDESALLLSSPLHPRTLISTNDRAQYLRTITNPKTSPEAVKSCIQKLVKRLQSHKDREALLKQENKDLYYSAIERKKRKKDKKTVLSTAAVLTTDAIKAIVAAREAIEEAKRNARE